MKTPWRGFTLGAVGLSVAVVAMAALAEESQARRDARGAGYPVRQASAAAPAAVRLDVDRLRRLQPGDGGAAEGNAVAAPAKAGVVDAFATKTWYVPPPPPPPMAVAPPPKPMAPPLPFQFMGRYDEPNKPTVVLLVKGDRLYTVTVGDSIDGTYRVDRVDDRVVEMIYLPLQEKQQLATGNPG